jgi:hypothetical protein
MEKLFDRTFLSENTPESNIEKINFNNCLKTHRDEDRLVAEFIESHLFFDFLGDVSHEYGIDEVKIIPIINPTFISLCYSTTEVLHKAILKISQFNNLMIDDDMGNILPYNQYVAKFIEAGSTGSNTFNPDGSKTPGGI